MRLVVFGLGYLGATHAACMAELGHEVLGVETNPVRFTALKNGELPFFEPGLDELFRAHLESGRLKVSDDYTEAAEWADVFFIAVGTPQMKGSNAADVSYVESVIESLIPLVSRNIVIFGKSTVPVGTCDRLAAEAHLISRPGVDVDIAWNPEFLREGHAIEDTLRPDRIVVGSREDSESPSIAREVYAPAIQSGVPFLEMSTTSAELVKVAANSFLATKISFINSIAEVCEVSGAEVSDVARAIGFDSRIGPQFLKAGIGFGGGCLPKDIRAFMARAGEIGAADAVSFLKEVDVINMRRRSRAVSLAQTALGGSPIGANVAVLGAAFKPESDDVRDSPALNVAGQLQLLGAVVTVYDPKAVDNSRKLFPTLNYGESIEDACKDAELVMILTEWSEFLSVDPVWLASIVKSQIIFDGRLCLDRAEWASAGWTVLQ